MTVRVLIPFVASREVTFPDKDDIDPQYRGKTFPVGMVIHGRNITYSVGEYNIEDADTLNWLMTIGMPPEAFEEYIKPGYLESLGLQ